MLKEIPGGKHSLVLAYGMVYAGRQEMIQNGTPTIESRWLLVLVVDDHGALYHLLPSWNGQEANSRVPKQTLSDVMSGGIHVRGPDGRTRLTKTFDDD
jgi:hypothetical protein